MSLVVPNTIEVETLNFLLNFTFTMRIYGNDATPSATSQASNFTEIAGGGYANKLLLFPEWTVESGNPSRGVYSETQVWTFTGAIDSPGSIYGYYVTRNTDGKLFYAERFPSGSIPFAPVAGSVIKVLPVFNCQSLF